MAVGNVNSAPRQDYKITAQSDEETKTLRERIKAEIEEKEKADANDRVEISAEGKEKAAQSNTAATDEGDKKPEPEDGKKEKAAGGKSIADDSRWQAEIAKIKQKRAQLLQQIGSADDENKRKKLEAQLAMTEAELAAKDSDAYRKSRMTVRYLGSEMAGAADAAKLS